MAAATTNRPCSGGSRPRAGQRVRPSAPVGRWRGPHSVASAVPFPAILVASPTACKSLPRMFLKKDLTLVLDDALGRVPRCLSGFPARPVSARRPNGAGHSVVQLPSAEWTAASAPRWNSDGRRACYADDIPRRKTAPVFPSRPPDDRTRFRLHRAPQELTPQPTPGLPVLTLDAAQSAV